MTAVYAEYLERVAQHARPQGMLFEFERADVAELDAWLRPETAAVCLGLVTLGEALDDYYNAATADDPLAAAVINEVALAWIVDLAQQVREKAKAGIGDRPLKVGPSYRPGVGRWPLAGVQDVLFAKLPTAEIGVRLDGHKIMWPNKSTSLIIPLRQISAVLGKLK